MAEFNIGNPIPWEPIEPGQLPIPGGEVLENIERAIPFPLQPDPEILEDAVSLAGVSKFPARIKCALLGWMAYKDAVLAASTK